jgi:hypothetical protein
MMGCSVAISESAFLSPAWLHEQYVQIYGSSLNGLWLPSDFILNPSGYVTSGPGRVGGTLANRNANLFTFGRINGRVSVRSDSTDLKALEVADGAIAKSYLAVTTGVPVETAYSVLAITNPYSTNSLIRNKLSPANWYSADGWSHYLDGAMNEVIPVAGTHIIEAQFSGSTSKGITIMGDTAQAGQVWTGDVGLFRRLSSVPSAAQSAIELGLLKRYFRI